VLKDDFAIDAGFEEIDWGGLEGFFGKGGVNGGDAFLGEKPEAAIAGSAACGLKTADS